MQDFIERNIQSFIPWFLNHGIKITIILIVVFIARRFSGVFIEKLVKRAVKTDRVLGKEAQEKRQKTISQIFKTSSGFLIWSIAILMILQELGFAIGPFLAAAGVAGLAFGFGGQYFIRDLISGLFIIVENQYRVGDIVCFDGTCGSVEKITVRMTTLRDLDGVVHHVPHGEIKKVSNLSKYFARVNIDLGISYKANLENVISVVNRVGQEMANDPNWKESINKAPQFLRVNDFGESAVVIKILGETKPLKQWEVAGELRKRLKIAFDKEGIEIPFPQRVIHKAS